jgi:large repetitive protein
VAALLQAGANITLTYNDAGNILTIASTASGGATGLKYTYNTTAGTGVISAADLTIATGLTINATDAQGKSASDVLARLKNGAIILVAKDESNWVRYAVTADYASGSVTVTVAQSLGAISSGNTVYLSIISDAPSSGGGALNQLSPGAITAAGGNSSIIVTQSIAASGGVAPYTYAWYKSATPNFVVDGSSLVSGATGTGYTETGLGLSETRYYRRVTTDGLANKVATVEISGVSNASVDTADGQPVIGSTAQNGQTIYKIQPSSPNGIYASGTATSASGTVDAGWDAGATSYTFTCPYAGNTNVSVWVRVGGVNSAQGYLLNMFSGGLAIYDATGSAFNVVTSSGALATSGTVVVTVTPTSVVFNANSGAFTHTITSTTYASNTGVGFSVGGSNSIPNFPTVT